MRKILHVDMDAFYASVEQRDRPELRGRPVAVGSASERGVVMTASYEARRFGVGSAMPTTRALRLCPELVVVPARFEVYRAVSGEIRAVFERYTDLVEPLALDEAYLDVTEPRRGPASATVLARLIKADIRAGTHLTASAGASTGKFLAKVASAFEKPNGLTVIPPERAAAFLADLPIERFHGVGPRTAERMRALGIRNGRDLRAFDRHELARVFGKLGHFLHDVAGGIDERPVVSHREPKSLSAETTFARDLSRRAELEPVLNELCRQVAARMERARVTARTITVKVRYADFTLLTRSRTLSSDLCEPPELVAAARLLAFETARPDGPIRLLGVSVSQLRRGTKRVVQPALPFVVPDT